jgi:hypothetical protein
MKLRLAAIAAVALALPAVARAGDGLVVGVSEDMMKWSPTAQSQTHRLMRHAGLGAVRVTFRWAPGQVRPEGATLVALQRARRAAYGRRLVLAVYSKARRAPLIWRTRVEYCSFVSALLRRAPEVTDVVVWNEPNNPRFWRPQYDAAGVSVAPAAYEKLLAQCWDTLHAVRPDVNLIAPSAPRGNDAPFSARPSHSPVSWWTQLAAAYRASGRDRPIFDTVGHNPYPDTSSEVPWAKHPGGTIGEGDYDKFVSVLTDGFADTAQPVPGTGLSIWYMEDGFQTRVRADLAHWYVGQETDQWAVDAAGGDRRVAGENPGDQAAQVADAIRLAYCQPYVGAFFNFLLADEQQLGGWQSGLLWANWTPKPAYEAVARVVANLRRGWVDCAAYGG